MRARYLGQLVIIAAAVLIGSGWPTPFTLVSIAVLPAGIATLVGLVKPRLIAERAWLTRGVAGASLLSLASCTTWAALIWVEMAEPELHLLPQGYTGRVVIIFDDPEGEPETYKKGRRLYKIPATGILRTRFSRNKGGSHQGTHRYVYYEAADGSTGDLPASYSIVGALNGTAMQMDPTCDVRYEAYVVAHGAWPPGRTADPDIGAYLRDHPVACSR